MILEALPASHPNPLNPLDPKTNQHTAEKAKADEVERLLQSLVRRRGGKANLKRSDMEKLDYLTRWLRLVPGGKKYRRGLAKYLRSKGDKVRQDPFRDFRRYQYDRETEE